MKELLEKYAELKEAEKQIKGQLDELNPQIVELMEKKQVEEVELTGAGKFSLVGKRKWAYPRLIEELELDLKDKKKEAEQTGEATYSESYYLKFSPIKND